MIASLTKQAAKRVLQRASGARLLWRGPANVRRVALTFDDGPHALTDNTLRLLADLDVPATFFLLGAAIDERRKSVREYVRAGHQIAGHGYTHQRFTTMRPAALRTELANTSRALGPIPQPGWVRPPHGSIGPIDISTLLASGYTVALWSLDSNDYNRQSADEIIYHCRPDVVRPGEVILFHEGEPATLAALPTIVEKLRADGYQLTTMADLFAR